MKFGIFKNLNSSPTSLMVFAGILYSSWPLGYWLNPKASHGLASDLGALHQPFNWLFISLDIGCGILVFLTANKLFATLKRSDINQHSIGLRVAILALAGFGLFTAIAALMPLNCIQGSANCQISISNSYFLIHGIFSIGSVTCLTISIFTIWMLLLRNRSVAHFAHITPGIFLIIWSGFGAITFYLFMHNQSSTFSQRVFIEFCSLWLVVLPYFMVLVLRLQQPESNQKNNK